MLLYERDHALVVGAVSIMKGRFVHEDHCFARSFRDEIAHLILRRDAGGGVVRIADVDQTCLRGSKHLRQIVSKAARQWHLYDFSSIRLGIFDYCFERWIRDD